MRRPIKFFHQKLPPTEEKKKASYRPRASARLELRNLAKTIGPRARPEGREEFLGRAAGRARQARAPPGDISGRIESAKTPMSKIEHCDRCAPAGKFIGPRAPLPIAADHPEPRKRTRFGVWGWRLFLLFFFWRSVYSAVRSWVRSVLRGLVQR